MEDNPNITPQKNLAAETAANSAGDSPAVSPNATPISSLPERQFVIPPLASDGPTTVGVLLWLLILVGPSWALWLFWPGIDMPSSAAAWTRWIFFGGIWLLTLAVLARLMFIRKRRKETVVTVGPEGISRDGSLCQWKDIRKIIINSCIPNMNIFMFTPKNAKWYTLTPIYRCIPFNLALAHEILTRVQEGGLNIKIGQLKKTLAKLERIKNSAPEKFEYIAAAVAAPSILIPLAMTYIVSTPAI